MNHVEEVQLLFGPRNRLSNVHKTVLTKDFFPFDAVLQVRSTDTFHENWYARIPLDNSSIIYSGLFGNAQQLSESRASRAQASFHSIVVGLVAVWSIDLDYRSRGSRHLEICLGVPED